jgi:hypothetical protein
VSYTEVTSEPHTWNLHTYLKENLDLIKENNENDWDFKHLYSGDGMTRTGKSTIACQCAQYEDPTFSDNWRERVIFDGKKLKEIAYKIGKNKAIVYDEAREGLDSKKQMEKYTKNLLDFFSQCGNLNQMIHIVLPEFFELPKTIAITQSIYLINCYARNGFERGYFDFFNRKDKKYLYVKGTKFLDYTSQRPTFKGTFINWLPFDRAEYETLKTEALKKAQEKEDYEALKDISDTHATRVKVLTKWLQEQFTVPINTIAERLGVSRRNMYKTYLGRKREP